VGVTITVPFILGWLVDGSGRIRQINDKRVRPGTVYVDIENAPGGEFECAIENDLRVSPDGDSHGPRLGVIVPDIVAVLVVLFGEVSRTPNGEISNWSRI
jgi:hypothetical protein